MSTMHGAERVETVVIGGGQAGLSVGYHLAQRGRRFVILEANARVGDTWRRRWDSLRLFTPARFDGLPGMPFPAGSHYFPTKDEFADYLDGYAARFELPVQTGARVERLAREGDQFVVRTGQGTLRADNVVVAMANFQRPWVPAFAAELDPSIVQLHSSEYRNPSQLRDGDVLIVGAGNSGSEIAKEVAPGRRSWISGRDVGQVPFRIESRVARALAPILFRIVFHRVLTLDTPMGRKVRPKILHIGGPLIRVKRQDLAVAGIERVPRTTGARDGLPLLADGRTLNVANVIWCTGFRPGFSWIDLPVIDERDEPVQERGMVQSQPGLYFVGLHFLYALSSVMIHGVGRDAERIARSIDARMKERPVEPRAAERMEVA